jgi:hypothetical protein
VSATRRSIGEAARLRPGEHGIPVRLLGKIARRQPIPASAAHNIATDPFMLPVANRSMNTASRTPRPIADRNAVNRITMINAIPRSFFMAHFAI